MAKSIDLFEAIQSDVDFFNNVINEAREVMHKLSESREKVNDDLLKLEGLENKIYDAIGDFNILMDEITPDNSMDDFDLPELEPYDDESDDDESDDEEDEEDPDDEQYL